MCGRISRSQPGKVRCRCAGLALVCNCNCSLLSVSRCPHCSHSSDQHQLNAKNIHLHNDSKHYHRQGEGIQVSSKLDSKVSNLPVAVAVSGHGALQNCYLKANIFYCIIYSIQKLLQNEWTTLIRVAVRWVLARSGHSWPVGSWTLIYDDKTFVRRKYCELCCTLSAAGLRAEAKWRWKNCR